MLVLAACTAGPPPTTYVLGSMPSIASGTTAQAGLPVILAKPVRLPDYLDTTDLVVRDGEQVIPSQTGRWGERLSIGVTRTLVADLSSRLPGAVVVATQPIDPPARQVLIDIDTFVAGPDGHVVMTARWCVADGAGRQVLAAERTALSVPIAGKDDAAVVAAMTSALSQLSDQIAAAIIGSNP